MAQGFVSVDTRLGFQDSTNTTKRRNPHTLERFGKVFTQRDARLIDGQSASINRLQTALRMPSAY
jgi:hypothetical protein